MKISLRLFLFCFLTLFFVFAGCRKIEKPQAQAERIEGAGDFTLEDMHKNKVTLSSYRGRQAVTLFFWTTWCPFCRKELKNLKGIYPQIKKEGGELLAINVGEPAYKAENFIQLYGIDFPVLLDKDTEVAYSYNVLGVPTYILLNKKGEVVFKNSFFPEEEYKNLVLE